MSGVQGRERLQPSLLDRLTDNQRSAKRDGPDQQALSISQMRQAVLRDLSNLLNTSNLATLDDLSETPLVARSTLNYGIPGFAGMMSSSSRSGSLQGELAEAIKIYEPRIRPDSLRVRAKGTASDSGIPAMVFEITGELWAQPVPVQLFLETKIEVETRLAVVTEAKSSR